MNRRWKPAVHWIAVVAALVPIPFAISDAIHLRLWQAEWYWLPFAVLYTLAVSLIVYWLVRGLGWMIAWLAKPTS